MYSFEPFEDLLNEPDVKSLREPINKVRENSKSKITEINKNISSLLMKAHNNNNYFPTTKNASIDVELGALCEKMTLLEEEMSDAIDVALKDAFYNYARLFSKEQIKYKNVKACKCQLCEGCVDSGLSVKVVGNYPIVIMCNGCFNKIESIKRTIVCPTKILLIPFILELPELQNLICEAFLSIV
jgi:hypothetical protein